jgi:methionyl-tRNA formyltransferase
MSSLNLVFAGTPAFAVPALDALLAAGHRIAAVYTQPDRPAGRGQRMVQSAVKERALSAGLQIEQPASLRLESEIERLASFKPDAMIVVAYGQILPQTLLDVPRLGCINIHGSLLPRWRGAAPIQRALLAGDTVTGINIMRMEAGLDTGPVFAAATTSIGPRDTAATLHDRLAQLGASTLIESLPRYASGELRALPQHDAGITYAKKLRKEEAFLDWRLPAVDLDRLIRGFNPWPIAETRWQGQQLRIWEALPLEESHSSSPGTVLRADNGLVVACGAGTLCLQRVQLAGRKQIAASEFARGQTVVGTMLGGSAS